MVLKQLDIHMQKKNLDTILTQFTKINSKWIIHLNIKHKTIKLLEDNIGEKPDDFVCGNDDFLDATAKVGSMKEIIDKLGIIEMKKLLWEDSVKGMRTNHRERGDICKRPI